MPLVKNDIIVRFLAVHRIDISFLVEEFMKIKDKIGEKKRAIALADPVLSL
jgi:hypothetical protein